MTRVWTRRLQGLSAGLLAATLAMLGVSGILLAAGDAVGGDALRGASHMTGLCFVISLAALAIGSARMDRK